VDYTYKLPRSYSKTHQQLQAFSAFHQTLGFGFFKAFDHSTISPYLMKTNLWLFVLNLFESGAVPATQNFMQYIASIAVG